VYDTNIQPAVIPHVVCEWFPWWRTSSGWHLSEITL